MIKKTSTINFKAHEFIMTKRFNKTESLPVQRCFILNFKMW